MNSLLSIDLPESSVREKTFIYYNIFVEDFSGQCSFYVNLKPSDEINERVKDPIVTT